MIALAAYTPHRWNDIGGHLICWWTRSKYSHVEIVIDGWCYSSSIRRGGVSRERIARLWSRKTTRNGELK